MYRKLFLIVCLSDLYLNLNSAKLAEKIVTKRSDVDLQTCIGNFAVHKDKIIRTQDSRAMGAKYLNEIDLGTREECLRLCCETENCDVFVYEEKNVGSCYLFQCGPPEDFKCKFTHHVNYSSGVLTVNRHLPDLESQIKLTKHEQDLSKLRKPEMEAPGNFELAVVRTTPSTTTSTVESKNVLDVAANTKSPPESGKCSRFQFECRSNRECIAIYNACDGIPQCTDGSDEAPELGCPAITTSPPPPPHPNNPAGIHFDAEGTNPARVKQNSNVQNPELYLRPMQHQNPQLNPLRPEVDFLRPDPRNTLLPQNNQYDVPQVSQYSQYPPQAQNWVPHQSNQMPPQITQYSDKNSHIFNHKESGLQVPEGQDTRYNKYKGAMQTLHRALGYSNRGKNQYADITPHEYPKPPNYYGEVYRPLQQMQDNWQGHPPETYHSNQFAPEVNPNLGENWQPSIPVVSSEAEQSLKSSPDVNPNWKTDDQDENPTHIQNKMAHELKHSKEHFESKSDETKQVKIEKHVHSEHDHEHEHPKYLVAEIAERLELEDGVAETPGGAILSLTLGLIITCLMAILIGCRLRVVRRRMRRGGGKSYAHDADYLVNGMYL